MAIKYSENIEHVEVCKYCHCEFYGDGLVLVWGEGIPVRVCWECGIAWEAAKEAGVVMVERTGWAIN